MLHWIYIFIALLVAVLILVELFNEKKIRNQLALALVFIPLILRILHLK
jgi:hypothetical protein